MVTMFFGNEGKMWYGSQCCPELWFSWVGIWDNIGAVAEKSIALIKICEIVVDGLMTNYLMWNRMLNGDKGSWVQQGMQIIS